MLAQWDFVLSPTMPTPATEIAYLDDGVSTIEQAQAKFVAVSNPRHAASLAGSPALSVPCGFSSDGLPVGLQIMGNPFEEHAVIALACAYQARTTWHTRRPDLKGELS